MLLSFLTLSLPLSAQDTATIVGTVADPSGAVISGAKVTVSNPDKAFTRELESNPAGEYIADKIPIGNYTITAKAGGFQRFVRSGVGLDVGQTLRVDLHLNIGASTHEIVVTGNVMKVETENATVSDVVTGSQITELELNGRNFVALALLVPGASPVDGWDSSAIGIFGGLDISFNGGRTVYNNWEVDGGNNTDEGGGGTLNTYPSLDTIAEFRISTSNYGAEMGKHAGATIEVATKSGTREFHGELFEFLRNDKLDANDWFANRQIDPAGGNAPKTPLKWNDFGYNLGGPFYIPGHYNLDRSKTFFFWSQNWRRYRQGSVFSAEVPSTRMRQGDFSECDPASANFNATISGCALPVDPQSGALFPGDVVPVDPNAKALMDAYVPLPNNGAIGYVNAPTVPTDWRQEQIRVDQNLGDKTRAFVRYTQDAYGVTLPSGFSFYSSYDTVDSKTRGPGKSAVLNLIHSFKPNLMDEFVMAYTQDVLSIFPEPGPGSPAGSITKPSSWTVRNIFAPNQTNPLLPGLYVCGGLPSCFGEDPGGVPWFNSNPIFTLKDNLSWSVGNHLLKAGFFLEKYQKNEQFGADTQGSMAFANWSSVTTGNALADLYLGRMWQYLEGTQTVDGRPVGGYSKGYWRMSVFEPYLQDDWKVSRHLTLNLGLRYYYFGAMHDVSAVNVDSAFAPDQYDPAAQAPVVMDPILGPVIEPGTGNNYMAYGNGLVACGTHGVPKGCYFPNHHNFAPRLGFAYDPFGTGKTVIRGGYGLYFEMGNGNESNAEGNEGNPPVALAPGFYNLAGFGALQPISDPAGQPIPPGGITAIPLHQKFPSVQQFSLGIQHEFPGNNLLSVSYVGNLGRHLSRSRQLNQVPIGASTIQSQALAGAAGCDAAGNCDVQNLLINGLPNVFFVPYQGYSSIVMKENTAVSSYNSLQANFRHNVGKGLTLEASYTWSHAIDDSTSTFFVNGVDDSNLSRWRASSDTNRTHVLAMNYIYQLPFFRDRPGGAVRSLLGGWKLSGITSFFSGVPINFGCGISGLSSGIGEGVMCNSMGKVRIKKGMVNDPDFGPTPTWFDPGTIGQVTLNQLRADGQPGMFGYMGRNVLTGPGRNNWDLALLKDFDLPWLGRERSRLQFRWETFNTFNHPQWNSNILVGCDGLTPPGSSCAPATLADGTSINVRNGEVNAAWPARVMQFGMKLIF
jgi:Carboxypeptidase regulatory-like domain